MLINSFENQSNLAEWFDHRNHYSVVVTRHKDLKRTEYKIQKNDYVYDMLKVKGSVTALVTCAKSLADNFPPTTTTDNKTVATGEQVGVVDSVGDALSFVLPVQNEVLENVSFVRSVLYPQNSLSCQDFDDINDALLCAMHQMPHRFNEFQAIQSKILSVFPFLPEYSDTVLDDDIPPIFAESGIFDKAE